ncbi:MAG: VOC family protein, partial [Vicinamibacteria bacterium]
GGTIGPLVSYPYGEGTMSEAVVRAPHNLLWTVPQATSRRPSPALDADEQRLHGELHSAVINVTDMDSALRFFVGAGGLTALFDGVLSGEPFERMMGLPTGVSLRIAFLAAPNQAPARLELMQFFGTPPEPGHRRTAGLSCLVFSCPKDDIEATRDRLLTAGGVASRGGRIIGPAGIVLDFVDPDSIEA